MNSGSNKIQIIDKLEILDPHHPKDPKFFLVTQSEALSVKAHYFLEIDSQEIKVNSLIKIEYNGKKFCSGCKKVVGKLFMGYCFSCSRSKSEADLCVLNPFKCHYFNGTCREKSWGESFCFQTHFVYLSFTDKFKIGITREKNIPQRWFDQGATKACVLMQVKSRRAAGLVEHFFSQFVADRTHWKKMLEMKNKGAETKEILEMRDFLLNKFEESFLDSGELSRMPESQTVQESEDSFLVFPESPIVELSYPCDWSSDIKYQTVDLEKTPNFSAKVLGMKGQYLATDCGFFNMRKHEGFVADVTLAD